MMNSLQENVVSLTQKVAAHDTCVMDEITRFHELDDHDHELLLFVWEKPQSLVLLAFADLLQPNSRVLHMMKLQYQAQDVTRIQTY
jgi:hypothetical protein